MTDAPLFSVLMPVFNPPVKALERAIRSVRRQRASWELVIVDDASSDAAVRQVLDRAARDPRVTVRRRAQNGGIVAASNDALEAVRGTFVALLDHDDELADEALATVATALAAEPECDYLYTDEDKIDEAGCRHDQFDKPDWSVERLRGQMYTGHLSVLRTSLVREVGGFDPAAEGSQDHDLVLRVTERARRVVHLPEVLYHWRAIAGSTALVQDAKPHTWEAGRGAVQRHLDRCGIRATATIGPVSGTYRIERELDPRVLVSIIIPTRGSAALVWGERRVLVVELLRSIVALSTHRHLEIVVVYDDPTPQPVLDDLRRIAGDALVLVPFHEPFNFSAKCNLGAAAATAEHLLFLNDDMQVVSPGFIEQLVAPLLEPGIGATGGRLLFADGRLQHGGHVYADGDLTHAGFGTSGDDEGPFRAYLVNREASGLTGACLALPRSVFDDVGGFTEALPSNFNDVDLSRKIRAAGWRMLWIADATLFHFESLTRDSTVRAWEYALIMDRWGTPPVDPYLPSGYKVG